MLKKPRVLFILFLFIVSALAAYLLYPKPAPLRVVSTEPADRGHVSPFLPAIITFNRNVLLKDVSLLIDPATNVTLVPSGKTIRIVPQTKFAPQTQYAVRVETSPPYVFSFFTEQFIENAPGWNRLMDESFRQYEQQNATQDAALIYINTHVPVKESGFGVNYSYTNNTYTVSLSPPYDQNKNVFLNWLKQQGVSNTADLRIRYINQ